MRKLILIAIAGAAVSLSACGSSTQTKTVTVSHSAAVQASTATMTTEPTSSTTTTSTTSTSVCDAKGINSTQLNEGSCSANGYHYTVVNSNSTLKLKTLSAHLEAVKTADSVSSGYGQTAVAHGRFVIVTLLVLNRLDSPQTFGGVGQQQTALTLRGKAIYSEDFDAENQADQNSCISKDGSSVQPGESTTCDVIFDVPSNRIDQLATVGNLVVANFGDDLSGPEAVRTYGIIRTYHPAVSIESS